MSSELWKRRRTRATEALEPPAAALERIADALEAHPEIRFALASQAVLAGDKDKAARLGVVQ